MSLLMSKFAFNKHKKGKTEPTFPVISWSYLSQIAVVISFHFQTEDFGFRRSGLGNEMLIQKFLWQRNRRWTIFRKDLVSLYLKTNILPSSSRSGRDSGGGSAFVTGLWRWAASQIISRPRHLKQLNIYNATVKSIKKIYQMMLFYQNFLAGAFQLLLNLFPILLNDRTPFLITLCLLFDAGNNAPRGTAGTHDILVRHRQQVSLLII